MKISLAALLRKLRPVFRKKQKQKLHAKPKTFQKAIIQEVPY